MNRRSIRDFSPGPELVVVCFLRVKPKLDERDSHDMLSLRDHDDFAVIIPGRLMYPQSFAIYYLLNHPGVKQRLRPNDKRRGRFAHNVVASFFRNWITSNCHVRTVGSASEAFLSRRTRRAT